MFKRSHVLALTVVTVFMVGSISGCASLIIGGAATAGVAAYQERGISGVAADTTTATKLRAKMLDTDEKLFRDVGIEVYEGRVLLTGRVATEDMRAEAVKLAWSIDSTKDVINELLVSDSPLSDMANDTWITTKLTSKITVDENIFSINYSIETVGGVIYLIGIAQDQAELDRVINHARSIDSVQRVVSHVRVKAPKAS